MANTKVEILGGQLDGSVLDNAASEATLRELVDAIKKLDTTVTKGAKSSGAAAGGGGGAGGKSADTANKSMNQMSDSVDKASKTVSTSFGKLGGLLGSTASGFKNLAGAAGAMTKNFATGNNNLSGFTNALSYLPGPLGKFASVITGLIGTLEDYQNIQRNLAGSGASFNNSLMDMRIAAAQSGVGLTEFAGFIKSNATAIGGLGDTITEGATKLAALGTAVGESGLDVEFMKLGMSAQGARMAAMRFTTELVKGDRVRNASVRELASASLEYEKELDLLAKQTGMSKDALRKFADDMIKDSGALTYQFAGLGPQAQAAMKGVMNTVGATMGKGAQQLMVDMFSGAAAGTTQQSRLFAAQMPEVAQAFKEMEAVAKDTSLSEAERSRRLGDLQAKAQIEQQRFLMSAQGQEMMKNRAFLSQDQQEFIKGLEKNQQALADMGIDIQNATIGEMQAKMDAKRAEQARQSALDAGMNRFQAIMAEIGTFLQTRFFIILKEGLNALFAGFDKLVDILKPVVYEFELIGQRIGESVSEIKEALAPVIAAVSQAFKFLSDTLNPVISTVKDWLQPALEGVSNFIQENMTPILIAMGTVLGTMAVMAIPAVVSGLIALGAGLVTAATTILAPFLPVIAAVAALTAGLVLLKDAGWDVKTALQAIKDNLYKYMFLPFKELFVNILSFLPQKLGGYSKEQEEVARQGLESEKRTLADREAERDKTRAENKIINEQRSQQIAQENKTAREEKRQADEKKKLAAEEEKAAEAKRNAIRNQQIADSMERSRLEAIKRMQEMAGITPGAPGAPAAEAGKQAAQQVLPALKQNQEQNMQLITAALKKQGITDPKMIAATLGNVMKETGGVSKSENLNYANTSNERIRSIFKTATAGKTDAELNEIKKDPQKMGEMMYGSATKIGRDMGNTEPGDGWKYRGRGFIQLTGKSNYAAASKAIYGDDRLVKNPDLVNDPAVAAEVSAWFMKRGQTTMAAKMGINKDNMTQEQANLLATSVIAGRDIRTGSDYMKGELLSKVTKEASRFTTGTPGGAMVSGTPASVEGVLKNTGTPSSSTSVEGVLKNPTGTPTPKGSQAAPATPSPTSTPGSSTTPSSGTGSSNVTTPTSSTQTATTQATQDPLQTLLVQLNNNIMQLAQLQGRANSIAEQQLRVQKGMSRDAYTSATV